MFVIHHHLLAGGYVPHVVVTFLSVRCGFARVGSTTESVEQLIATFSSDLYQSLSVH